MSEQAHVISIRGGAVAPEVAEAEFLRWVEAMDLDCNPENMDANDLKAFEGTRRILLEAIERGTLRVDDRGQAVFTPSKGVTDEITFYEPTGATFMAMDGKRSGQDIAKTFSMLADMTRQNEKRFATMANRDLRICRALLALFLA